MAERGGDTACVQHCVAAAREVQAGSVGENEEKFIRFFIFKRKSDICGSCGSTEWKRGRNAKRTCTWRRWIRRGLEDGRLQKQLRVIEKFTNVDPFFLDEQMEMWQQYLQETEQQRNDLLSGAPIDTEKISKVEKFAGQEEVSQGRLRL